MIYLINIKNEAKCTFGEKKKNKGGEIERY